jgi:hypothetical protein
MSACGGANVHPIDVVAGCPEQPLRSQEPESGAAPDALLDDFEDGDTFVARLGGRDGSWVETDDHTSTDVGFENSTQCAARGLRAGHFWAGGLTQWDANLTGLLRRSTVTPMAIAATPYDGTGYGGVSFWGAIGSGGPATLEVPLGMTTMDTAWNGNVCTTKCMDYHRTSVTLTPEWRRYEIRFADLKQLGWGDPQVPLALNQLVGFILWPTTGTFDIWIDDVRLEP